MIKPIYTKHHTNMFSELKTRAQLLLDEVLLRKHNIKIDKDLLIHHTTDEIIESQTTEDQDLQFIQESIEKLPVCTDVKELIQYISECIIKRNIKYLIIHTTATSKTATATAIFNYWKERLGWKNPGYHILFHQTDGFTVMADFDRICNGVAGQNSHSIHLSYIGGIDEKGNPLDNRSEKQKQLLEIAIVEIKKILPHIIIKGHNDFSTKACPCFDAKIEYNHL